MSGTRSETASPASGTEAHDPDFPERFRQFMRTGWRDSPLDVPRRAEAPNHAKRRALLSEAFPGQTLVVPTGAERIRANDTTYPFRPGSDHVWLTGEHEPDSVLVLTPTAGGHDATLYVRPRSTTASDGFFTDRGHGELWIGRRPSLAEKSEELEIATERLDRLGAVLDGCAPSRTRVLRGLDPAVDAAVRSGGGDHDRALIQVLAELRLVKDEWEIAQLQAAVDASVLGFEDVARALPEDRAVSERLIEGVFGLRARHDGNGVGYSSIVASGPHATVLHWMHNDGSARPGDLLLMDMGVEGRHLYTADITRTLPVSGLFTPLQRQVYDIVHRSQRAGIAAIRPGIAFDEVHQTCMRVLAEGLADLGVLPVSVDEAMARDRITYRRWTLHGFGHMLGLDVHDCARARKERYRDGVLGEGHVLTMEPGLYFQPDDELIPAGLRGIGIRIEDDVLVTADGARVLSAGLPTGSAEVESWLATQRAAGARLPGGGNGLAG
ncbi:MAG: aminopeptidase P family protein [Dactylosporangium sp.]|nr:aminopeptidase P family protein [Dactylosporangium sp.]NNJ62478.1 aminopeptidase P family protein [Dactylosporangium sp.]